MDKRKHVPQAHHSSLDPYASNPVAFQDHPQWRKYQHTQPNENPIPGLSQHQINYGVHTQPTLQINPQDVYGTTFSTEYKPYPTTSQNFNYNNAQINRSAIYGERTNMSSSFRDINLPKIYNTETYEDYGWQSSPNDANVFIPGLHQSQMQSETDVFQKQYNDIQQMKLQQQMLFQTQAQMQQQHTFAQRQLLLQQMHGVRPPPNLMNMQETDLITSSLQSPESETWKSNMPPNIEVKSPTKSNDSTSSSRTLSLKSPTAMRHPNAKVTMSGILYKQGSDGLKVWRKRWFVLADYCLFYYKNQDEQKLLGSILLPSYKISPCMQEDKVMRKYAFKCEHANMRTYVLAAPDFEQMAKWMKTLTAASLLQDISFEQQSSRQLSGHASGAMEISDHITTNIRRPTYVNAPPKPKRSNDCASPIVDQKYFIHQEESLQKSINQHPIENIYQHGRFPEKLPTQTPAHGDFYAFKADNSGKIPSNKIERRTPEAYGRSAYVVNYEKGRMDYEDIYSSKRNNIASPYSNNLNTPIYDANISLPDEYLTKTPSGPAILRKKKTSYRNVQQQNVPRPHSADFLEYEGKSPIQQKRAPSLAIKKQPQRPKSSLDINSPHDPSSDNYYTEERYAEKMREFGKYLRQESAAELTASTSVYKPDSSSTVLSKSCEENRDSNWTLKAKPLDDDQNESVGGAAKAKRKEEDNFLRSASARLPSRENNEEDKKLQQREESMKRLLEWKQRMLQSPLTRKSTPASISLGVSNHIGKSSGTDKSSNYSSEDDEIDTSETQAERSETQITQTVYTNDTVHTFSHTSKDPVNTENNCELLQKQEDAEQIEDATSEVDENYKKSVVQNADCQETVLPDNTENEEYTDNDLDEVLADYGETKQPEKKYNENIVCSTPPVCPEEHYLPMSPRKVSLATPQETPARNLSAFNEPISSIIYSEDSPYVEMNSGMSSALTDEGQTYELVCVSKHEHLYMELCNFASAADKKKDILDSDSNTEEKSDCDTLTKNVKESFPPLPDLVHDYDTIARKQKMSKELDTSLSSSNDGTLKRMSISDTFRPASYYLTNSKSMSNLKDRNEKYEKENTIDRISISSNDKPSSSNTSSFSSASNLNELINNTKKYKKKTTSLMISGSRPSIHETIFRGEKIRRSRGNLFLNDKQLNLDASASHSATIDSDSFSTCTEGRNSLSSKCDSIPSIFTSETASLSEVDDTFKSVTTTKSDLSFHKISNSTHSLEYEKWSSLTSFDNKLDVFRNSRDEKELGKKYSTANQAAASASNMNTLPIAHSRSYSSPAKTNSYTTLHSKRPLKIEAKTSVDRDVVDGPNDLNVAENLNESIEIAQEKFADLKKVKDKNCLNICHCRSVSADQPAPYYYSDLSNSCLATHFTKNNNALAQRSNVEKKSCLIFRNNDTNATTTSQNARRTDLSSKKAISVEFLLSENNDNISSDSSQFNIETMKENTSDSLKKLNSERREVLKITDDTVWDKDLLWRDNLRRASRCHAKSMDNLDMVAIGSTHITDRKIEQSSICKLARKVNYVNEDLIGIKESICKKTDYCEDDDNDVYVSLATDAKITDAKITDEGAYESLTVDHFKKNADTLNKSPDLLPQEKIMKRESITEKSTAPIVVNKSTPPEEEQYISDSDSYVEVLSREIIDPNKRPLVTGRGANRIPIRAVSPRVRWDSSKSIEQASLIATNETWLNKMEHLAKAGELKAGDLLGRTHEELLMLLLLLRKNQAKYQQTIQECYRQLDNIKERTELERVRAQLAAAELQHERVRPLLQLVDSMVRLGALYHQPLQRVESAHQARAALLEHLATCGPEDAAVRVRQLRLLEQQLSEDAATLHSLSSGKHFINSVLGETSVESREECEMQAHEAAARNLDEELARVHHMLALNSKVSQKLEETVTDNARLERALLELRHRLHLAPQHAPSAAALHNELRRVQALVPGLQRQRRELGEAVAALSHRAAALAESREATVSSYGLAECSRALSRAEVEALEQIGGDEPLSPLYVDTNSVVLLDDNVGQSVQAIEKAEIKTVRIVKRESERRQRDRERLYSSNDWYSSELDAYSNDMKKYTSQHIYDKHDPSGELAEITRNLSIDDQIRSNPRDYYQESIYNTRTICDKHDERRNEYIYGTAYDNSRVSYDSKLDKNQYGETKLAPGGSKSQLSPIFKSKAAKEIVTEMHDESSYRRAVPKVKRRHNTAPSHHLSTNALADSPKQALKSRARDDTDLARALRGSCAASGAMRPPVVDLRAIDALFAAPNKISIPERYVPEKSPELTPEEMKKRLEKVESIKKMLSSSTNDPSMSPDSEEKKQREHLLHMNQILAHQVMEMSKIVAANANKVARNEEDMYDSEEQSPEVELPIYQQRENYFS